MNFNELVLEALESYIPKLKRGMKVKLPEQVLNQNWHTIKDPHGYITNVKKNAVGTGADEYNSKYAYRVEYVDTDKMTIAQRKTMAKVCKYSKQYGTNGYCYIDARLLDETNPGLAIKHELTPQTKETFGDLIDEL